MALSPYLQHIMRNYGETTYHIFFGCSYTRKIWQYFLDIFNISFPRDQSSPRQVLIYWWLEAGSKTLGDIFKHNLPGMICWHIWKNYSSYKWGKTSISSSEDVIWSIKHYTQNWAFKFTKLKQRRVEDFLIDEHLIPANFKFKKAGCKIIKWKRPTTNYKLNVDASFVHNLAFGGAILRNRTGELVWAICFNILADSSEEAELKALVYASEVAMEKGYTEFQVETDAACSISVLEAGLGRYTWLNLFVRRAKEMGLTFCHVYREGNEPAHLLAGRQIFPAEMITFDQADHLPRDVRTSYFADLFGIPRIRV
ncbi:unnamed protein product [Cuscuta epithymum]|uniref:RNase H type-1 domain-containing protein n=1 Tax=Cuscuta epithymum TaxID=186058 RepID=A0AAV0CZ82_9ASTE|nr:unnamed protein product [Cuscuta epithymum]